MPVIHVHHSTVNIQSQQKYIHFYSNFYSCCFFQSPVCYVFLLNLFPHCRIINSIAKINSSTTTFSVPKQIRPFLSKLVNCVFAGDPVLYLCPAGHYCDGIPGSDFASGAGPRPCPLYTYRASPGAGSKGDCLPCPPGSHCNSTGLKHSLSRCSQQGFCPTLQGNVRMEAPMKAHLYSIVPFKFQTLLQK